MQKRNMLLDSEMVPNSKDTAWGGLVASRGRPDLFIFPLGFQVSEEEVLPRKDCSNPRKACLGEPEVAAGLPASAVCLCTRHRCPGVGMLWAVGHKRGMAKLLTLQN